MIKEKYQRCNPCSKKVCVASLYPLFIPFPRNLLSPFTFYLHFPPLTFPASVFPLLYYRFHVRTLSPAPLLSQSSLSEFFIVSLFFLVISSSSSPSPFLLLPSSYRNVLPIITPSFLLSPTPQYLLSFLPQLSVLILGLESL